MNWLLAQEDFKAKWEANLDWTQSMLVNVVFIVVVGVMIMVFAKTKSGVAVAVTALVGAAVAYVAINPGVLSSIGATFF